MGRRKGIIESFLAGYHGSPRERAARERALAAAARRAERERRLAERLSVAQEKERARLYAESRAEEAEEQNHELEEEISDLKDLLQGGLKTASYFDLDTLKEKLKEPAFEPGALAHPIPIPQIGHYLPQPLSRLAALMPGAKGKHEQQCEEASQRFEIDLAANLSTEQQRLQRLEAFRVQHEAECEAQRQRVRKQHEEVEQLKRDLKARSSSAVVSYFTLVFKRSDYPEGFPGMSRLAYVPESKQLVIELELPAFDIIPTTGAFRYVKAKDEIVGTSRTAKERKALYSSVIAQTTLRTLHDAFSADRFDALDSIVLNGHVDTIDKATGKPARPCVVTVRTTRDVFSALDLQLVDPDACLRALHASVSRTPEDLSPVRPVLEFNMVDPRFIEEVDVLSSLDQRPNLMELTPGEFENLITNLFQKMGLETKLTRASRDGGVDCVAFDPRPVVGGKVVIQAKRYKHTVGVSAVRDLFGTLQNEGASKGILVTTSGYGAASFEFAKNKPIELLEGVHLLHLLAEHAGIQARIVMLEDWKDPTPDSTP